MQALSRWYLETPQVQGLLLGFTHIASAVEAADLARRLVSLGRQWQPLNPRQFAQAHHLPG
ncbi:hypothetical protein thsps117_09550 [Pseudomonas sp. No.117]